MRARYRPGSITAAVLLTWLVGCGGGGSGDGEDTAASIARVDIASSGVSVDGDTALAALGGDAFVSPDYVLHACVGLACLFGWFDNSYPGVDVSWTNLTTGAQGAAVSRYGTATAWAHLWSASVPVTGGPNRLRVTAADPAGNTASASVTVEYIPPAPDDLRADTGDAQVTLLWTPVPLATGYRVYWSIAPGEAFAFGTPVDVAAPPWVHSGLANGTTYYYAMTSLYAAGQSAPSPEVSGTAGAPSRPAGLVADLAGTDVQLSWDDVAAATSYTLYWQNEPGVTKQTGNAIPGAVSPYLHTGLSGLPYHYVVTASNGLGESLESDETGASPPLPPPAPDDLTAVQRAGVLAVDVAWRAVPGAVGYTVYRCTAWANATPDGCEPSPGGCDGPWEALVTDTSVTGLVDWQLETRAYWYEVTALNAWGSSPPSDPAGLCVVPPP